MPEGAPVYTSRELSRGEAPKLQTMISNLLADRFKLVLHHETKELPVYNLVVARPGRIKLSEDQTPALNSTPAPLRTPTAAPAQAPRGGIRLTPKPQSDAEWILSANAV